MEKYGTKNEIIGIRIPATIIVNIIDFPLKFSLEITKEVIEDIIRFNATVKVATITECKNSEPSFAFIIAL